MTSSSSARVVPSDHPPPRHGEHVRQDPFDGVTGVQQQASSGFAPPYSARNDRRWAVSLMRGRLVALTSIERDGDRAADQPL